MKAKSVAVLALVLGGMFIGTGSAMAEDDIAILPKPVCAENEYMEFDENGEYFCTEVAPDSGEDTPGVIDSCWVTEDGVDVCARGFVTGEEPEPIDETCTTTINEDGTENFICADWMSSTGMVPDGGVLNGEPNEDGLIMEKTLMSTGVQDSTTGTLAFLGLFFGLVGGAAIALNKKSVKK